jgi:hypothetical protein
MLVVVSLAEVAESASAAAGPMHAPGPPAGVVRGDVTAAASAAPVRDALIRIPADGVTARSGRDGSFRFAAPVRSTRPYRRVTVVVTAPGFGPWRIVGAPLSPDDQLILHVTLSVRPFTDRVLTPDERARMHPAAHLSPSRSLDPTVPTGYTCSGWDDDLVPPSTIWVYRTKTGISERYDFVFYATHVLPNEWISSWDSDSLGAGAIAVRTYAAWRAMTGHAYSQGDNCADVRDTIDGLFDPSWTTAAAEQAVYATWGSVVLQNGDLFVAHYFAGSKTDPCAYVTGQYAGWMSQWGTQNCALGHVLWPAIVDTFYDSDSTPTTWKYTRNLVLDPSVDTASLYAYKTFNASFTWTKGTGADGIYFLHLVPKPRKTATIYQHRAFLGAVTTPYHDEVWLRCAVSQPGPCAVTLRVLAFPDHGASVAREKTVSVPKDGTWHRFTFDPPPHGIAHVFVRTSVVCAVTIDLDRWTTTAPFGGP